MKEKPIIFSTEMVRAIQNGRKSQTRRVIKPQPPAEEYGAWGIKCPYKPGDVLWAKEAWGISTEGKVIYKADYMDEEALLADGEKWRSPRFMPKKHARIFLLVTNIKPERLQDITEESAIREGVHPWGLETQQRIEKWCRYTQITDPGRMRGTFRGEFAAFWDSLNAKRGYGWKENPWVWVIEFRKEVIKHD